MELKIKFDEELVVKTANRVLDEFKYNGKTIREWADLIANPKTNADRIRAMTDEELAKWFEFRDDNCPRAGCYKGGCHECWLDWLKSPADKEGEA